LAQGKKVLVTAKGDSALAVLQEKIPAEIRHLTVALLSDERGGMKQFEQSIQSIANELDSFNFSTTTTSIEQLEYEIDVVHSKLALIDQKIKEFAEKHMMQIPFQGREILPEELAKFVIEHEDDYSWFKDDISTHGKQLGFGDSDIAGIRSARMAVLDDLPYINSTIPSPDSLPNWEVIKNLHNEIILSKKIKRCIDRGELLPIMGNNHEMIENAKELLNTIAKIDAASIKVHDSQLEWFEPYTNKLRAIDINDPLLSQLFDLLEDASKLDIYGKELLLYAIHTPSGTETNPEIIEAIKRLSEGKRAFKLPIGSKQIREKISGVTIRGFKPSSREEWFYVFTHINYLIDTKKLIHRWNAIVRHINLPILDSENITSFNSIVENRFHIIELSDYVLTLEPLLRDLVLQVFGINLKLTEYDSIFKNSIKTSLTSQLDQARFELAFNQRQELLSKLDGYSGIIATDIREYLQKEIGEINSDELVLEKRWSLMKQELKRLAKIQPHLREIDRVVTLIENLGAQHWAQSLREIPSDDDNDPYSPPTWLEAMNWRSAKSFIEKIDGHQKMKSLFTERKQLELNLAKSYRNLVAQKTWLGVYLNSPDSIKQALQAYLNAIQAMGTGTGVRAVRYRRNAREAMNRAYTAVPCWILPQWRVSETLPPELGLFDLVIIDEASQSDIWALPCLLRGKKLLVVGDNKQVSPSAVGMKEAKIEDLVKRFLKDQPHGDQMTYDKSIYDLAKVIFAGNSVTLKEHFRCVPSIIEFSNREFYGGEIKPLRIPKSNERLDPPLIDVFVKGGHRKGDINRPEAKAIVDEIKVIIADPNLAGRSIGVLTLLGTEQSKYIWDLLNNEIDQIEIVDRLIEVGSPTVFQGRERDIILISNILAKGDRSAANKLEIRQRLNVAMTRARDRMYLFRSVDENDFGSESLTAKTIRHFTSPYTQDAIKVSSLRELCESDFEREMFDFLVKNNYRIKPQVKCGSYRLDFVVEGSEGRRLAIECDGDRFHGPGQWMDDMNRQRVLERIGWTFWRCFASSFVLHRDDITADLLKLLNDMGIEPLGSESVDNSRQSLSKTVDPYGHEDLEDDSDNGESTTNSEAI
jgi:very-short-patch-repair endonuclease